MPVPHEARPYRAQKAVHMLGAKDSGQALGVRCQFASAGE